MEINSVEWWDKEFESGNWETGIVGSEQTKLFAEIAYSLLSPIIKQNIYNTCNNFCDFGCAYGEGIKNFIEKLAPGNIDDFYAGVEFAKTAREEAMKRNENIEFHETIDSAANSAVDNIFDVIYCSNVLEHYQKPCKIFDELIENSRNYVIVLVPYQQEPTSIHPIKFTKEKLEYLIYLHPEWDIVQQTEIGAIDKLYSPVSQILVVYKKIF